MSVEQAIRPESTARPATGRTALVAVPPVPSVSPRTGRRRSPGAPQAAHDLLADAGRGLGRAIRAGTPGERYAAAHLAALRGAAAVLATRARPRRAASGSAWDLLARVAPEFGEWAAFFGAGSAKRQAAEAGLSTVVGAREADDMVRQASVFLDLVEGVVGAA